ncbi:MAG: hypothetical protein HY788_22720 [Deltaproteobacteria bacterium]|nr:hypothetical protein [Deltaproteobacteria bacterium]
MQRIARIDAPGDVSHHLPRDLTANFFHDDTDRNRLVDRPAKLLLETAAPCLGWALIRN